MLKGRPKGIERMKNSRADLSGAILSLMEPERSARKMISLFDSGVDSGEEVEACCSMNLGGSVTIRAA